MKALYQCPKCGKLLRRDPRYVHKAGVYCEDKDCTVTLRRVVKRWAFVFPSKTAAVSGCGESKKDFAKRYEHGKCDGAIVPVYLPAPKSVATGE